MAEYAIDVRLPVIQKCSNCHHFVVNRLMIDDFKDSVFIINKLIVMKKDVSTDV